MSILLVGMRLNEEVPAPEPWPWWGTVPETVARLMEMGKFRECSRFGDLGLEWDASVNLLWPSWNDPSHEMPVAKMRAKYIKDNIVPKFSAVILAGRVVQVAFGVKIPFMTGQQLGEAWYYAVPHPSSLCRWWNEQTNLDEARRVFARIVEEHKRVRPSKSARSHARRTKRVPRRKSAQ